MIRRRGKSSMLGRFMGNKKGLSEVVTNLLLILLVLVAVGVVWVVVQGIVSEGAGNIEVGQFTFNLQIQSAYVSGTDVLVNVKRNTGGGELSGIKFIFYNGAESTAIDKIGSFNELERKTFTFTSAEIPGIAAGDEVSVAPIYESGEQKTGGITDSATISGSPPGSEGTGNPGTGICGDEIIQIPNSNSVNEECDGSNLGSQTCIGLGFDSGTLSCDSGCQFDTSQCIGPPPPTPGSCNGVWEGASEDFGVECDGTPLPNGCANNCACEMGFTLDGSGGCNLNPPLDTGIIFSVWHNLYFDSNNLPKSDAVTSYINNYVNFSGSAEPGCFLITFADYIIEDDISYLRVDDSLGVPNIAAGQGYSVWEAQNCGQ